MFRSNVCLPENSWPWSAFFGGNVFGICKIIYWAAPLLDANHPPRMIILSVWNEDPNREVFPIKQRFPFLASSGSTSYLVSLIINFVCLFLSAVFQELVCRIAQNSLQKNLVIPFEVQDGEITDHYILLLYIGFLKPPMSHRVIEGCNIFTESRFLSLSIFRIYMLFSQYFLVVESRTSSFPLFFGGIQRTRNQF